jgi:hypothetical protein
MPVRQRSLLGRRNIVNVQGVVERLSRNITLGFSRHRRYVNEYIVDNENTATLTSA